MITDDHGTIYDAEKGTNQPTCQSCLISANVNVGDISYFKTLTLSNKLSKPDGILLRKQKTGCSHRCSVRPLHTVMKWHELPKYNGIQVSQLIYENRSDMFLNDLIRFMPALTPKKKML